ncbi:MAG: hypothetical protein ACE37N_05275 [Pseudohongiellaceae bacterium]
MELQDKLSALVEEMPAFSSSVTRIMELTSDINCAPKDMVEVIDHDPVMTVKISSWLIPPFHAHEVGQTGRVLLVSNPSNLA